MPNPGDPPNRSALAEPDGRPTSVWAHWFTALLRAAVPTSGVFYIPAAAGAPTTVPEARSGFVAMTYDTAGNDLYVYNGAWKKVTLT